MGMTEGIAASYAVNIGPPREGPFGESAMETLGEGAALARGQVEKLRIHWKAAICRGVPGGAARGEVLLVV